MKKILFIHHTTGWGGAPINMINIINSLNKSKYKPEVLLLKDSIVSEKLRENNIPVKIAQSSFYKKFYKYYQHTVPGHIKWYNIRQIRNIISWILSRYYFAPKELANHDFDLVHLNSSVLTDWLAPCKANGKKVVMHVQEPVYRGILEIRHTFFKLQMQKYTDCIIAISKDNAKRVGLPKKTKIIYNYTDISKVKPLLDSYKSKKVLYLGGSTYIKGFFTLIDALDYIDNDIKIIFAGNYPPEIIKNNWKRFLPKHKKMSKALGILRSNRKAVEVGLISNITSLLGEVCCLVSPFSVEHFSRPIIEAFANYKPVIATEIEGMDEIVDHNVNGILVKKDHPKDLAEAINYLCNNSIVAKEMGINGFEKASKLYSPNNVSRFEKVYDQL